jgi:hypothetical protein
MLLWRQSAWWHWRRFAAQSSSTRRWRLLLCQGSLRLRAQVLMLAG